MTTYYRGVNIQNQPTEKRTKQLAGLYRGVSWKIEDLKQSLKQPRERVYRGVKYTLCSHKAPSSSQQGP